MTFYYQLFFLYVTNTQAQQQKSENAEKSFIGSAIGFLYIIIRDEFITLS